MLWIDDFYRAPNLSPIFLFILPLWFDCFRSVLCNSSHKFIALRISLPCKNWGSRDEKMIELVFSSWSNRSMWPIERFNWKLNKNEKKTTDMSLPDMMKNLILSSYMTRKLVAWKLSEISHGATFINRPGSGMYGIKFWRKIRKNLTVVMCGSLFSVLSCNSCMWRQAIGWPISARNNPFGNPRISTTTWKSNNLDDLRSNKNQIINEFRSKLFSLKL